MARKKKQINYSEKYFERNKKVRDSLAILYVYSLMINDERVYKIGISREPLKVHLSNIVGHKVEFSHTDTLYKCWDNQEQLKELYSTHLGEDGFYREIGTEYVTHTQTE